jgi:hypothetical protein
MVDGTQYNDNIGEHERRIIYFLDKVRTKLSEEDIIDIVEFAKYGEWGLAYETLCMDMYAYKISINNRLCEEMTEYGKFIRIDKAYYLLLKELATSDE